MCDWVPVETGKPVQKDGMSAPVDVRLDTGEIKVDFLINGTWTYYCEKNPNVPKVIAWRYK